MALPPLISALASSSATKLADNALGNDLWMHSDPWQTWSATATKRTRTVTPSPAWKRRQRRLRQESTRYERNDILLARPQALAPRAQSMYVLVSPADMSSNISLLAEQVQRLQWELAGLQHATQLSLTKIDADIRTDLKVAFSEAMGKGLACFGEHVDKRFRTCEQTLATLSSKTNHMDTFTATPIEARSLSTAAAADNGWLAPFRALSSWLDVKANAEKPEHEVKQAEAPKEETKPAEAPKEELKPTAQTKPAEAPKEAAKPAEAPKETDAKPTEANDVRDLLCALDPADWSRLSVVSRVHRRSVKFTVQKINREP